MSILKIREQLRYMVAGAGFLKQETGSLYVEMAISVSFFLMVVFATMEVCSAAYSYTVLADAANEGVHFAIHNSADQTGAVNLVKNYAASTFHDVSAINVTVTYPDGLSTPPNRVAVNVSYSYVPYLSAFMTNPPTMHAFAEGRMVH